MHFAIVIVQLAHAQLDNNKIKQHVNVAVVHQIHAQLLKFKTLLLVNVNVQQMPQLALARRFLTQHNAHVVARLILAQLVKLWIQLHAYVSVHLV